MTKGIERFKQAIKDQQNLAGCYLGHHDAEEIAAEIEDELAHVSWAAGVPAPVDADGEVVPLTTKVMYDDDGGEMTIKSFAFYVDGSFWRTDPECPSVYAIDRVDLLHLHRPDSWELLEMDVRNFDNNGACGYYGTGIAPCNEDCPGYKDLETPCEAIAMKDVLLRAEALAERDAKGADHA